MICLLLSAVSVRITNIHLLSIMSVSARQSGSALFHCHPVVFIHSVWMLVGNNPEHNILRLLEAHSSWSRSDWSSVDSVRVVSWQQLDALSLLEVQSSKFLADMGLHLQTRQYISHLKCLLYLKVQFVRYGHSLDYKIKVH